MRYGLATTFLWVGALRFRDYEVENAEPLVTASPLTSRLHAKLGAQRLARLTGITQITLGSLIAAKPVAPNASAAGSFGAAGMMLGTLSFLVTTPEAWQEGQRKPRSSMLGEALLKDSVLLGASLLTAADSRCEPPTPIPEPSEVGVSRKIRASPIYRLACSAMATDRRAVEESDVRTSAGARCT